MEIPTYIEEFKNLVMKSKLVEPKSLKLARCMKGLRLSIQDELSLKIPTIVNQCYQLALKVKEKFKRRNEQSGRNRGNNDRGRGNY